MVAGKKFAVFDIDGTLIRWQLYHAIADALAKRGHISAKTYADIRDARLKWKRRTTRTSFADYQVYIIKAYEAALLKLSSEQLELAVVDVFEEYKDQTYTYTRELIKKLKQENYLLLAISGSQVEVVAKIAEYYGFDDWLGTIYKVKAGKLSKRLPSEDKKVALEKLLLNREVTWRDSIAVGDSASDIAMLEAVEQPIAFNPEDKLLEHAVKKRWPIIIERKNVIYKLEPHGKKYILA